MSSKFDDEESTALMVGVLVIIGVIALIVHGLFYWLNNDWKRTTDQFFADMKAKTEETKRAKEEADKAPARIRALEQRIKDLESANPTPVERP